MHVPHELQDEFPNSVSVIERLAKANEAFRLIAAAYDDVNRQIWQIESERKPASDETVEKLKKRRLLLKDDIAVFLAREQRQS